MSDQAAQTEVFMVYCTCPDRDTASALARELVAENLAACCNVVEGMTSVYRWQGKVEEDPEVLLIAKTTRERYPALERSIQGNHPYELPEILAVPVTAGLAGYLDWVAEETRDN